MYNKEIVASIYTCLEMLRIDREDLHAQWCGFLYTDDGDIRTSAWNDRNLNLMENDIAFHI